MKMIKINFRHNTTNTGKNIIVHNTRLNVFFLLLKQMMIVKMYSDLMRIRKYFSTTTIEDKIRKYLHSWWQLYDFGALDHIVN